MPDVGTPPDEIVEAVEARFASPFRRALQRHPDLTMRLDGDASQAICAMFAGAVRRLRTTR